MDKDALILGNLLVGNQRHAAGIEICLGGLQFSVDAAVKIALTGTPKDTLTIYSAQNNQKTIPAGKAVWLEAGDRVETGFLDTQIVHLLPLVASYSCHSLWLRSDLC